MGGKGRDRTEQKAREGKREGWECEKRRKKSKIIFMLLFLVWEENEQH